MDSAYVLIQTAGVTPEQVVSRLQEINGVRVARPVSGPYDVVVFAVAPHEVR